jgi:hypothetical protein
MTISNTATVPPPPRLGPTALRPGPVVVAAVSSSPVAVVRSSVDVVDVLVVLVVLDDVDVVDVLDVLVVDELDVVLEVEVDVLVVVLVLVMVVVCAHPTVASPSTSRVARARR